MVPILVSLHLLLSHGAVEKFFRVYHGQLTASLLCPAAAVR